MNHKNLSDNQLYSRIYDGQLAKIIKIKRNIFKPDSVKILKIPSCASLFMQHSIFETDYEPIEVAPPPHLDMNISAGTSCLKAGTSISQKVAGFTSRRVYLETDGSDNLDSYTYAEFTKLFSQVASTFSTESAYKPLIKSAISGIVEWQDEHGNDVIATNFTYNESGKCCVTYTSPDLLGFKDAYLPDFLATHKPKLEKIHSANGDQRPTLSPAANSQKPLSIDDEIRVIHASIQNSVERLQYLERLRTKRQVA